MCLPSQLLEEREQIVPLQIHCQQVLSWTGLSVCQHITKQRSVQMSPVSRHCFLTYVVRRFLKWGTEVQRKLADCVSETKPGASSRPRDVVQGSVALIPCFRTWHLAFRWEDCWWAEPSAAGPGKHPCGFILPRRNNDVISDFRVGTGRMLVLNLGGPLRTSHVRDGPSRIYGFNGFKTVHGGCCSRQGGDVLHGFNGCFSIPGGSLPSSRDLSPVKWVW